MKLIDLPVRSLPVLVALALVAMLGLQGLLEYRLVAPLALEVTKLSQDLQQGRARSASDSPARPKTALRLEEIMSQLHDQSATAQRIERLHQVADQNAVVLRKAGYRSQAMQGDLSRHEIQAEIVGTYPAIRQFLRTVLAQDDAATLDLIEFSRPVGGTGVRAQLRISLYFRRAAS